MTEHAEHEATALLMRVVEGDEQAAHDLLPLVYADLRARAGAYFRGQPANHTLQPTALVHESYLKLIKASGEGWKNRGHFCAVATTAMRQILVNHAKRRGVAARAQEKHRENETLIEDPTQNTALDLLTLDEALTQLAELDPRQAQLVEFRFFGGMTIEEVAEVLGVSKSTIDKEWRRVRAWLQAELKGKQGGA